MKTLPLPKWTAKAVAGIVVAIIAISAFVSVNNAQKTAVAKENALSAQYLDNQNELSSYLSKVHEMLGVADSSTAALDKVLLDAVKGRYTGASTARPGGGQLFSAITEAYPNLAQNQALYAKVMDAVNAGREAYKDKQSKLLDMLADYDTFRHAGIVHAKIVAVAGVPTPALKARVGSHVYTGQAALDKMSQIVLTSDGLHAYQSGVMDPLNLGPSK